MRWKLPSTIAEARVWRYCRLHYIRLRQSLCRVGELGPQRCVDLLPVVSTAAGVLTGRTSARCSSA